MTDLEMTESDTQVNKNVLLNWKIIKGGDF